MNRLLAVFATFTLLTLVCLLGWMSVDFLQRESHPLGYIRAISALLGPVPLLIFAAFVIGESSRGARKLPSRRAQGLSLLIFGGLALLIPVLAPFLPDLTDLRRSGAIPIFANSWLFCVAILNFLLIHNLLVAAAMCGLSLGVTIHIIFQ